MKNMIILIALLITTKVQAEVNCWYNTVKGDPVVKIKKDGKLRFQVDYNWGEHDIAYVYTARNEGFAACQKAVLALACDGKPDCDELKAQAGVDAAQDVASKYGLTFWDTVWHSRMEK